MYFNIKNRAKAVGRKLRELMPELEETYKISCTPSQLSNALNGVEKNNKAMQIVEKSNEIVTLWENEK